MSASRFDEIESLLQSPRASGIFVVEARAGSPAAAAGIGVGDIVTAVSGAPTPDLRAFLAAVQPGGKPERVLEGVRRDGSPFSVTVPAGRPGIHGPAVKEGVCAWRREADCGDAPDFSAFEGDGEWWLRSSFGEERAGYERVLVRRRGDRVEFDHLTHFGGGAGEQAWTYRSQVRSTHRLDRLLSTTHVESLSGTQAEGQSRLVMDLGDDGGWRGEVVDAKGARRAIDERPGVESLNAYAVPMLALTMPLRAGARLAFPELAESTGSVRSRSRLECLGRSDVRVNGRTIPAWCFGWRHWGESADFERFYVSDDRRLVRIEWGDGYGGCWCEAIPAAEARVGIPAHIRIE